MRIGIDLGGSHIGVGLVNNDEIIDTRQKNFLKEDKINIRKVIIDASVQMINDILENQNMTRNDIEFVGIASPRFDRFTFNC